MAVRIGHMSTTPPDEQPWLACTGHRPGRGPGSEEESLAFSLMMLSRGVREEPVASHTDVAAPPPAPLHVADVPAGVAHGLAPEPVLLINQAPSAPAIAAASQTPPWLDVFAPVQGPRQVLPSPVASVGPSPVPEQVVPPSQAPGPVLASTQAREHMAVVGVKKAAHRPKPTITKPRNGLAQEPVLPINQAPSAPVVAAATQTPPSLDVFAPGQAHGQVLPSPEVAVVPSPVLAQVVRPSQALAPVLASAQAREPMAVVRPKKAAPKSKPTTTKPRKAPRTVAAQRQSQAPEQAASQELLHECPVCHKAFNKSRSLNIHMNCHPDGRRHPCEFCMSTFPSSSALRSHVRRSNACGGNNRRRLGPVAAAAIAWHSIDLNMPDI